MKYTKKFILISAISMVLLSCSNMPTGTNETLKLKDRAGRYIVNGNFDKDIELNFIIFETGNINFIASKADKANNLGTYVLGNPESTNKTFSFDIKETINGVAPNTYFIDFLYAKLKYSGNEIPFEKISDSTNIKFKERIGVYYNQNKNNKITVSENKIEWSYFTDAYMDITNQYSEETEFIKIVDFINDQNENHIFMAAFTFTDNSIKFQFTITDPAYSQYNIEEEYRISWE
ncbi:hypothetical protein A966_01511 [Brachyspira hampsonii 30446]|uniref:Lipoprotein n=1 Tax=Brachyspira hampsonii 30446 TaxID=1289135 RepID=A0A2U4FSD0_9SPIR|nr:hypothetical protein [Brachyspira hampsonii]EKV58183.1 hypothetical protein A966_01511 [Brachyspira hampsonii 30446]MBW5393906.1 hypothetical protein [Brachyspira hampsonii]OEJ19143.1 hypothetical protein A9495_05055 [Brachyspira hampsonii]